ncbi:ribosome silencing factor [Ligilactobacillus pobuzihii]|uniref:Ribosomal silencing factor RsfS n=1 Tax=Ligilactobacillus pobuzihii TaxID=449659 RepID=A0A0R2LSI2_9LACO|nr:ribosome silencing factor [Ligilactobacillus pobuzihii]HIZ95333.1 ribosome silencing factor [Candidatus Ligilactobacillus excrementavium]KRK11277.1 Iojap-like protein [Ligilactobacillus pobuzihii E100301 = KCTC 13174]KRO02592.1 Iojap-like protein [Ligilactobacillus pobuzihii]MBN7275651.1 ribosome silencing factor [Ligilactobacillus pobuzihii]GEN47458.1 ribosomal silencing factor RsfS [Ligilactobacillus pobuzihii]
MDSKELLQIIVEAADNKRAEDITALDVEGVSLLADYFVIMDASSQRQVQAIAENVEEQVEKAGYDVQNVEGKGGSSWILLDLGDIVVHVFQKETREFYNLEKLWADAKKVDLTDWVKE